MNGKSKYWAIALLASVLLLGGAAGAVVDRALGSEAACPASEARSPRHEGYLAWLSAELDLTADQRAHVEATVEQHRGRASALWSEMRPRFEEMKADLRAEIRGQLTDAQLEKYEELLKTHAERRHNRKTDR